MTAGYQLSKFILAPSNSYYREFINKYVDDIFEADSTKFYSGKEKRNISVSYAKTRLLFGKNVET